MGTMRQPGRYEVPAARGELPATMRQAGGGNFTPGHFLVLLRPEQVEVVVRGLLEPVPHDDPRQSGWASWEGALPERVRAVVAAEALEDIGRLEAMATDLRAGLTHLLPSVGPLSRRGMVG